MRFYTYDNIFTWESIFSTIIFCYRPIYFKGNGKFNVRKLL